ncbi:MULTISPECIES: hypothetical protein [Thalassolituus]|jgi:Tfp pilus assembly protein PilE|uniref:hypothetical protein n=1 Tax=Thalassolituus TaxID=187492 RepID=UPI000C592ED1|nr:MULTISPECIES: hypothetical protein [Thalassolituus]MAY14653.1 hypothetical protein [Oceanospirillaceae bacterium]PIQ40462.1 MAG: hypothetical protein COW58_05715 [Thalassolituus sp. CG17_big_fil_post_rev_8_21_14_2_50_53_8]MCA6061953.1 hypothetical protein [Thalassolituus sp. ST750PaO-4]MCB2385322.1 hypothetical protein [Thalassolituus alkanivorans]MCB2421821.1 hypothetical protein [Thalassolituus alkanivorans]|tara:strand:- start:118 stop:378 length:261 start_codon:yes stop_codon:yes gene_type:complete
MKPSLHLMIIGLFTLLGLYLPAAELPAQNNHMQDAHASLIRNATFMEKTPEFTDLYIIQTSDKGRQIVIYCNSAYCYKRNGHMMTV